MNEPTMPSRKLFDPVKETQHKYTNFDASKEPGYLKEKFALIQLEMAKSKSAKVSSIARGAKK